MVIEEIKKLDYTYSKKLGTYFALDSKVRLFFQIMTQTGTAFAWLIVLAILFVTKNDYQVEIASLAFITLFMLGPVFVIKHLIRRSRPDFKDDRFGTIAFDKFSFPSGHATRATYAMIIMPFYTPTLWWIWLIWGLIMIISRLILGVHYISDILSGIILSSLFMITFILLGWVPIVPFIRTLF